MKKIILIILIAFFSLNFRDSYSQSSKMLLYKDNKQGFSIQYPPSFKISLDDGFAFKSKDGFASFSIFVMEVDLKKTLMQLIDGYFEQIGTGNEWDEKKCIVPHKQLERWNADKGSYGFATRLTKEQQNYYLALVIKGKKGYFLLGQVPKSKEKKYQAILKEMTESFQTEK